MSKSQDPVPLPEGVSIRPTTLADKDEALNVLDSVNDHGDGRERLPAYYDYLISLPEVKGFGLYMDEKMVGFIFAHLIDDGSSVVLRMSRINPKYQGRRLFRILARHAGYWGVVERGATSVVATEADIGPHKDDKVSLPRYERVSISWKIVMLRLDPEDFEPIHAGDQLITEDMEFVSDRRLSELFQNNDTRKYIAPTGMFQVHTIPFKPIESNIPFIRGLPDSTRIYSDLKHANSRCVGLLSCSSRFTMPEGGTLTNVVRLNVFGDDPSSFRKHLIRHLMDITEISEDIFVLDITLPNEYKLDEIGKVLKDYGVEVEEWRINTASSSRVHLMEWGKF